MSITINSVDIPPEYVDLASRWYDGMGDMLYAVASTGGLTLGNRRPYCTDKMRSLTDEEWYAQLWGDLECSLRQTIRQVKRMNGNGADELDQLEEFLAFAERTAEEVRTAMGVED